MLFRDRDSTARRRRLGLHGRLGCSLIAWCTAIDCRSWKEAFLEIADVDRYAGWHSSFVYIAISIVLLVALVDGCGELHRMRRERQRCWYDIQFWSLRWDRGGMVYLGMAAAEDSRWKDRFWEIQVLCMCIVISSFIFYLMAPKVAPVVEMESHLFPKHNPRHWCYLYFVGTLCACCGWPAHGIGYYIVYYLRVVCDRRRIYEFVHFISEILWGLLDGLPRKIE